MLADGLDVVIGVDTHQRTHTAAVVSVTGVILDRVTVPADPVGYRRLAALGAGYAAASGRSRVPAATAPA